MDRLLLFICISSFTGVLSQLNHHNHHPPQNPDHLSPFASNQHGCPAHQTFPSHRTVHGHKCYEFILTRPNDWQHAQRDCKTKGGHLITIETSQEETYIMQELQKYHYHGRGVWTGLNDLHSEGHFHWDSGKAVGFTHWDAGQPDDRHYLENQDCVLLYVPRRNDFHDYHDGTPGWHDQSCSDFLFNREDDGWICEYEIANTQSTAMPTQAPHTTIKATQPPTTTTPPPPTTTTTTATTTTTPPPTTEAETTTNQQTTADSMQTTMFSTQAPANFVIG